MAGAGFVRTLYRRAADTRALRRPLDAVRLHPRVRALARRHVGLLLARGASWTNVDSALRLLAEDPRQEVVFGPWDGEAALELLYWAPFVRWAQAHFSLDPAQVTVVSRGSVAHWYGGACATYLDAGEKRWRTPDAAAWFGPDPVLGLVEEYRAGAAAPRPLLQRPRHELLPPPADGPERSEGFLAVALGPTAAFPETPANRVVAKRLLEALAVRGPVVPLEPEGDPGELHRRLNGARGLVAAYSGLAVLGVLSGLPVIALCSADGQVAEPDLDLAQRVAIALGGSLAILDAGDLDRLRTAIGGRIR
jgi:hypothetical protein